MERIVVVDSLESVREALVTRGTDFSGRPQTIELIKLTTRGNKSFAMRDYSKKYVFFGNS